MSLAPGEQQALTEIEVRLRAGDPRLARLLDQFGHSPASPEPGYPPASQETPPGRYLARVAPAARLPRLLVIVGIVVALGLFWAVVLIRGKEPAVRSCGSAGVQVTRCQPAGSGHGQPAAGWNQAPAGHP